MLIRLFFCTFIAVNLAAAQSSKPLPAFDQQLIDSEQQLLKATEEQDSAAVTRATANDFLGIGPNGDFYGKDEIAESDGDHSPENIRAYDFKVVKLTDSSAVVAYNLIVPGERPRYRHMADTWAKINGRWQLKFRQITPNLWSANDTD